MQRNKTKGRRPNAKKDAKLASKFSKGKKFSNKDAAYAYSNDEAEVRSGKPNDVSWYVPDATILNDVARIPYSFPVGYPFTRDGKVHLSVPPEEWDDGVSGICTMYVVPTIGNAKVAGDAVNTAANGMYTFVRHLNSGSRNYDANDLMIYVMAVDSLYYMISWMTRLYATLTMYSQANRYLPRDLIEAQSVDFDDLLQNIAQFRADLNARIRRVSTLCVPSVLPIFQRHSWMFQNYYIEGPSEKDQIYQYCPDAYYVFGYDSTGAGMLNCRRIEWTPRKTAAQLISWLDDMINPIIDDEDFNIISGDIYKAYQGNILSLTLVPDLMPLQLVYNEEVLLQFKNAKCKDVASDTDSAGNPIFMDNFFDIVQAGLTNDHLEVKTPQNALMGYRLLSGGTTYVPVTSTSSATDKGRLQAVLNEWSKDTLLVSPHPVVEPAENMVNTRLSVAMELEVNSSHWSGVVINKLYFGSEWPLSYSLATRHRRKATGVVSTLMYFFDRVGVVRQLDSSLANLFRSIWPITSTYRYLSEQGIVMDEDDTGFAIEHAGRSIFEIDNYTLQSATVIGRLHDAAIMGEFNIPRVALFPTR